MSDDVNTLKRTVRKQKAALVELTDLLLLALDDFDAMLVRRTDLPKDLSRQLGQWANALDMANDSTRYFGLGVDHRKDNKPKAIAKLRAKRATAFIPPTDPDQGPR
jgi:lipase chaperone LimK